MSTETINLTELLVQLGQVQGALPFSRLYAFSDLAGKRLSRFCIAWDAYPTAQRRRLVRALVELAEASFEVNFDAIFRHCLSDPDPDVRATAVDGLWENEETTLVGPLLAMLRTDPAVQVRAAAASGLGRFVLAGELEQLDSPVENRITSELLTTIHLATESVEVRRRAVESVAYACTPEVLQILETAYYDDDELMQLSAVVGMGRSCDKRWSKIVLAELETTNAAMRYEAALASGGLGLRQAVPTLVLLLDDADALIRDAAIWSLGQIGGKEAKDALLEAYENADEDTRTTLEEALAEQALAEGDLEFVLYGLDEDYGDDLPDDDLLTLWIDDKEPDDEMDRDGWEL